MRSKLFFLAAAAGTASVVIGAFGCDRPRDRQVEVVRELVVATFGPGVLAPEARRAPDQSPFISAANPIGRADEAERRYAEEAFARGEGESPHAIGGGPASE
ncbi:MAG: hypothetical protein ACXVEF_29530 [Polyangiales bacterium]